MVIRTKSLFVIAAYLITAEAVSDEFSWRDFKVQYAKQYSAVEEIYRYKVFQKNLLEIEEHNARYERGETSYLKAVNRFADLTKQEIKTFLNLHNNLGPKSSKPLKLFISQGLSDIPDSLDWREKNAVTPVKNQTDCEAGWAFSVTGALEGQLAIHKNQTISLSEQDLIDCSTYNDAGCFMGDTHYAFMYIEDHGICSEDQYPYSNKENDCKNITNKAVGPIPGYATVEKSEDVLKEAVATIGPISIAVCADGWDFYSEGVYNDEICMDYLNHAALVVGYGTDDKEDKDYWIVKNSWGNTWGENGYIRINRGIGRCGVQLDATYPLLVK